MKQLLSKFYDLFCKFISPPYCAYCRKLIDERTVLCSACCLLIKPVVSHKLKLTETKELMVHALSAYEGPLKTLILRKNRADSLASAQLGKLLATHLRLENLKVDYLVPVPLHWTRFARRGFNQAEIMAHELTKKYRAPIIGPLLRTKRTPFQSIFSGPKRLENVKDAFKVDLKIALQIRNKHIVLIDDLMTTGATLQAIAKKLLPYNPASISAIVACRVTPNK